MLLQPIVLSKTQTDDYHFWCMIKWHALLHHAILDDGGAVLQWRALKYSGRVDRQRTSWQKFIRKVHGCRRNRANNYAVLALNISSHTAERCFRAQQYQAQLRAAQSTGPQVRFDEGGREYTDSGSAAALVVPKQLARGGLPPEQRGEIWQVMSGSAAKRELGRGQYGGSQPLATEASSGGVFELSGRRVCFLRASQGETASK